jgi:predicted regulator of Ras-like GTPase activity (Roadblock/LC7/MglB family)
LIKSGLNSFCWFFGKRTFSGKAKFIVFLGGVRLIQQILDELITSLAGSRAVVFLDGEGEMISQSGDYDDDLKLLGAWKEIHLDHIREIAARLGLGAVNAVLFSLEEGNELIVPVAEDYCLLLFLSNFANVQDAITALKTTVQRLRKDIE